jgi:hypothetical protein
MKNEPCTCYICKKVLEADEGEEFFPYEVPDLPNENLMVCSVCEDSDEHKRNLESDRCNRAAEDSYQEWCAEEREKEE